MLSILRNAEVSGNLIDNINDAGAEAKDQFANELNWFSDFFSSWPDKIMHFSVKFVLAVLIFIIGTRLISFLRKLLAKSLNRSEVEEGVKQFLDSFVKVALYVILIIFIASYFGVQTTSLVAILGSAGVTIALALQGSLSNFTGGVLILLLKPFKVGDYIIEDNHKNEGTVIEIQMFYTKLRTVDDKIVVLPNGSLANTSLTNLNLSPERRICLEVGISYSSDIKIAKKVIKRCIEETDNIMKDREINVFVSELADSSVILGFRFFVENEHYWSTRWEINEKIKVALDEAGVEIPFNQLDVHIEK